MVLVTNMRYGCSDGSCGPGGISNESMDFNDPKELDDPRLFDDTSITDGLVSRYLFFPFVILFYFFQVPVFPFDILFCFFPGTYFFLLLFFSVFPGTCF